MNTRPHTRRAGGHFSPHLDGPWVPHEDESSVFTVVVYLNSDFQGGETRFLDEDTKSKSHLVNVCHCILPRWWVNLLLYIPVL